MSVISYSLKDEALWTTLKDGSFRLFRSVKLHGLGHDKVIKTIK